MGKMKKPENMYDRKRGMGFINRASIRGKLLIVIMTVSLSAMLLASGVFLFYQWFAFHQWLTNDLSATAGLIARNTTGALAFEDPKDAESVLESLQIIDSITAACLYTREGKVFASWYREGAAPLALVAPEKEGYSSDNGNMMMARHVIVNDQVLGTVLLRSNQIELITFVTHTFIAIGLMLLLGSLFSLFLSARLQKIISHPVSYLARIMESVSKDQDYSVRGVRQSDDELGQLSDHFNNMLTQIEMRDVQIREREYLLRSIIDNTSSVVYLKDPEGRYIMTNRRYQGLFLNPEQIIEGKTDYDIFSKHLAERFIENDRIVLEKDIHMEFEEQVPHKDGLHFYISSKFPLHNEQGQIYAICGISTDITERKLAEAERERLLAILENTSDMVSSVSADGRLMFMNHAGRKMLGWGENEELGRKQFSDVHPGWATLILKNEALPGAIEKGIWEGETAMLGPDENEIPVSQVIMAHKTSDGELEYFSTIVRDITEPKRTEAEMSHLRSLLKNIIDSMPSVIIGVDPEGLIMQWNSEAERTTGLSPEKAIGKPLEKAFPRLSAEMARVREAMQRCQTLSDPKQAHLEDGETCYEDVTVYPLIANGVQGAVIRIDNVTDKVRIEEMMIQSEKMLSVGGLAAGMAHEINNPLAGILQNVQVMKTRMSHGLVKNKQTAEECGTSIEAIEVYMEKRDLFRMIDLVMESGKRAAKIVANMLNFSRKSDKSLAPYAICDLLDQTVELAEKDYDFKKKFDFRQIEIVREYDQTMPLVMCEGNKIQQVFLNILKNGTQAMAENKDKISRFTLRVLSEDNMACIEIEDNGPGMDESTRKRVFEPFFTTKPIGTGTGLGLSVSYFIITENRGGTMAVESAPGKGTKFIIRLPIEKNVH